MVPEHGPQQRNTKNAPHKPTQNASSHHSDKEKIEGKKLRETLLEKTVSEQRLHRSMWSASFAMRSSQESCFQSKTLDKKVLGCVGVIATTCGENPETKAKVERCRSDMDKFKCIILSLRTGDNNRRSLVQRKETVEYITTMVKFSLVKRISCWTRNQSLPTRSSGTDARLRKRRRSGNRRWRHLTCSVRERTR